MRTDEQDEWDLEWDDEEAPPRSHRRTRHSPKQQQLSDSEPRRSRRGKTWIALFLSLALVAVLGGGAWYGVDRVKGFFIAPDYTSAGSGSVEIEITEGQTSSDIAQTLEDKDVVKSAKAFTNAAKDDDRSLGIAPGFYNMRLKMKATDALELLLDPTAKVVNSITIPEGKITTEIYAMLAEKTGIAVADFETAAADPVSLGIPESWYVRDDGKEAAKGLEGFLFPATYELPRDGTASEILTMMVTKFLEVTDELDFVNQAQSERQISPYEVLIAASIAQVEAPLADDMAKVTRVMYNRLYGSSFSTHRLEIDSSVNYWFKVQGQDPKASEDLYYSEMHNLDNPYNTYDVAGWTIGPISNPGEDALNAAINPDSDTSILYWVTVDQDGNTAFSTTYEEHEANCDIARANGVL